MKLLSKILLITSGVVGIAIINISVLAYFNDLLQGDATTVELANKQIFFVQKIREHSLLVAAGEFENRKKILEFVDLYETYSDLLNRGGFVDGSRVNSLTHLSPDLNEEILNKWKDYKQSASVVAEEKVFNLNVLDARDYVVQNSDVLSSRVEKASNRLETLVGNLGDVKRSDLPNYEEIGFEHVAVSKVMETLTPRLLTFTLEVTGQSAERFGALEQADLASELSRLVTRFSSYLEIMLEGGVSDITGDYLRPLPVELQGDWREVKETWTPLKENLLVVSNEGIRTEPFQNSLDFLESNMDPLIGLHLELVSLLRADNASKNSFANQIFYVLTVSSGSVFVSVAIVIRRSLSPISKMMDASRRIQKGEYGIQVGHRSEDEVGSLVKSFNLLSSAMKEKIERSKEIDKAKDEFLAMITHELKTPLVPIQGYSELLLDGTLGQLTHEQNEKIRIINESSLSLTQLIQDLLDVRRLELHQLNFRKVDVNAEEVISTAIQTMKPGAEKADAKLVPQVQKPIEVVCDPARIVQVVTNLIKNSIRYVPPQEGIIEVAVKQNGNEALFSVKDNGIGIPKNMQEGLFKKFYQVDTSVRRKSEGSGLGLAICKGIVEAHGGKMYVESDAGKGATFYFTLPLKGLK
ncbi:MAG: sensor histidine kinase [Nitrososphaerales archaeon]